MLMETFKSLINSETNYVNNEIKFVPTGINVKIMKQDVSNLLTISNGVNGRYIRNLYKFNLLFISMQTVIN